MTSWLTTNSPTLLGIIGTLLGTLIGAGLQAIQISQSNLRQQRAKQLDAVQIFVRKVNSLTINVNSRTGYTAEIADYFKDRLYNIEEPTGFLTILEYNRACEDTERKQALNNKQEIENYINQLTLLCQDLDFSITDQRVRPEVLRIKQTTKRMEERLKSFNEEMQKEIENFKEDRRDFMSEYHDVEQRKNMLIDKYGDQAVEKIEEERQYMQDMRLNLIDTAHNLGLNLFKCWNNKITKVVNREEIKQNIEDLQNTARIYLNR